ncbi:colicin uptake protein TolQ [Thalassovita gelatinovora]|uniref:Colicin uptake protein TolQ n=1 Tax=Thalassovita gelatinovora TaxID=53501 RepID=A0A0P1FH33_THAGE|nr:MotA/TolQ/ExbB proton channel family protein [Thalassovita gelatinovora]QIZ81942.1 MotA/TolQ/ExbB proton channel family protein [Thalassovita gelatinovora]CUH67333.1 colicin uptake protein TolQ [Thalassovita gelatinovora]SEP76136.1 outer membrane transport energization protein ExbB [Thalassovita gelatinovora]
MAFDTQDAQQFLETGGPALVAIAVLSVLTLAIILWKLWRLGLSGAWSSGQATTMVETAIAGHVAPKTVPTRNIRARFVAGALKARGLPDALAREEVARLAGLELAALRGGLRPLELIVTIAPLIGLLGTVLGMIEAFQALETSAGQADPAVLAGGIWEALLTTAAGMAVAIPAAVALSWFEGICDRVQADMEDMATRLFTQMPGSQARTG